MLACSRAPALAAPPAYTPPEAIDRAVMGFTGAMIGQPGGARLPADPRLRLAACSGPLALAWHNPARTSVQVQCPGPAPWRIFVAVMPDANTAPGSGSVAIKRGDNVTIAVRGRGFSLQQAGEATQSGSVGDWIFVRTARRAEPLRARIERPGLVVIPAS